MTPNRDLEAVRAGAPKGMRWLCVTWIGDAYWQTKRGSGRYWLYLAMRETTAASAAFPTSAPFAIDLKTGTIHLQNADGSIVEVGMSEWGKA